MQLCWFWKKVKKSSLIAKTQLSEPIWLKPFRETWNENAYQSKKLRGPKPSFTLITHFCRSWPGYTSRARQRLTVEKYFFMSWSLNWLTNYSSFLHELKLTGNLLSKIPAVSESKNRLIKNDQALQTERCERNGLH